MFFALFILREIYTFVCVSMFLLNRLVEVEVNHTILFRCSVGFAREVWINFQVVVGPDSASGVS